MFEELKSDLATVYEYPEDGRLLIEIWLVQEFLARNGVEAPHLERHYNELGGKLNQKYRGNATISLDKVTEVGVRIGAVEFLMEQGFHKNDARKKVCCFTGIPREQLRKEIERFSEQPRGAFQLSPALIARRFKEDLTAALGDRDAIELVKAQFKASK